MNVEGLGTLILPGREAEMTIYRVKPEQKPFVVKTINDAEIKKLVESWDKSMGPFEKSLNELQGFGKIAIGMARECYKLTDKKLKDKTLTKQQKVELLDLRKRAYAFTTEVKKLNLI